MEPITSGSTTERIVRSCLVMLLALGAAGWCFYDAYIGYPTENLRRFAVDLTPPPEVSRDLISPAVNRKSAASIEKRMLLEDVTARLGEPGWRGKNTKGKEEARFFGPAGQIIVTLTPGGTVLKSRFREATYKSATDLVFQKGMGVVVGVIAVLLILHGLRVMIAKTILTDEGIKISGRPLVPFSAMTDLHAEHYAKKGWVDLDYDMDGRQGTLRLDDYKIKAFREIIAEICRRKGYEDPYKKWQEEKKASTRLAGRQQADGPTADSE